MDWEGEELIMLTINNLKKSYGSKVALKGFDYTFANTADGGRQEYVEGSISYGYKKKLGVAVEGYYFKDGVVQKIYAQGSSTCCNYQKIFDNMVSVKTAYIHIDCCFGNAYI